MNTKRRRKAARKAGKLQALIVRWSKLRADLDALERDTPARFFDSTDAAEHFEDARCGILDVQARIAPAFGKAASRCRS